MTPPEHTDSEPPAAPTPDPRGSSTEPRPVHHTPRRWTSLHGNWTLYVLLVLLAVCTRFHWRVTVHLELGFHPLPYLLVAYLGYKSGRWLGALAGFLAVLPWTLHAFFSDLEGTDLLLSSSSLQPFEDIRYISALDVSVQHLVLSALLGFAIGWLFDRAERALASRDLTLEDFLPPRERTAALHACFRFLRRWILGFRTEQGSARAAGRRLVRTALPGTLVLVAVVLNVSLFVPLGETVHLILAPRMLSAVLVLIFAFLTGSRSGVALAVTLWLGSLTFLFTLVPHDLLDPRGPDAHLSVESVAQAVGLAVLAWWAGQLGAIHRDEERRRRLQGVLEPLARPQVPRPAPSALLVPVVALLCLGLSVQAGPVELVYHPHLALFLVAALWARHCNAASISNTYFWILLPTLLLSIHPWSPFPDAAPGFSIQPLQPDAVLVVLLASVPLLLGRAELSRRSVCRLASFGFLGAWTFHALTLGHLTSSSAHVLDVRWLPAPEQHGGFEIDTLSEPLYLVSWALQLILFELATRLLHLGGRTAAAPEQPLTS